MLRILQQFILTTLFAVFASQASAMFIQADWFDPTEPGVGTNRYAYSNNDPINKFDPLGNAWIDRAWDNAFGDGSFDRTFGNGASNAMDDFARGAANAPTNRAVGAGLDGLEYLGDQAHYYGPSLDGLTGGGARLVTRPAKGLGWWARTFRGRPKASPNAGIATATQPTATPHVPRAYDPTAPDLPQGIGVGQYASPNGGVPASRINKPARAAERRQVGNQFEEFGCHNCGTRIAGTRSGNPITDHQPPSSLNLGLRPQEYYPHCASCSARQGGMLRWFSQ